MLKKSVLGLVGFVALQNAGCAIKISETETGGDRYRPYQCRSAEIDGPGVIGGKMLSSQGRIGRGVVFLMQDDFADSNKQSICTGTLIGANMILTAGHCVDNGPESTRAKRLTVVFDNDPMCSISSTKVENMRLAEEVTIHPDWKNDIAGAGGDIALVRFQGVAPSRSAPLSMGLKFSPLNSSHVIYGAGFGRVTDLSQTSGTDIFLRLAKIRPATKPHLGVNNDVSSRRLTFDQSQGQSLCSGDSGGPAMIVDELGMIRVIGVASYVKGFESVGKPNCINEVVHTNIAYYTHWLARTYEHMKNSRSTRNPFDL